MACRLDGANPLSEIMLIFYKLDPKELISMKFYFEFEYFNSRKCIWTCHLRNGGHFVKGGGGGGGGGGELIPVSKIDPGDFGTKLGGT